MPNIYDDFDAIPSLQLQFAWRCFDMLCNKPWQFDGKPGMFRSGYSTLETESMQMMSRQAEALGMDIYEDAAGNRFFVSQQGDDALPVRMMGSHVDAVPNGGAFDGPAGVVAALTALYADIGQQRPLSQKTVIAIWRNEESPSFGQFAVGSKLATGRLGKDFIETAEWRNNKQTLAQTMRGQDIDPNHLINILHKKQATFPMDSVEGFIEAHIEQETILTDSNAPIGLVNAARGNLRFPAFIEFFGERAHSGTTRMDKRISAERAGRAFLTKLDTAFAKIARKGDLVWEAVDTHIVEPSQTAIASHYRINMDIRSVNQKDMDAAMSALIATADNICSKTGLSWNKKSLNPTKQSPVMMDQGLRAQLANAAKAANLHCPDIASGAGHDAMVLAEAGIPAAMLFMAHNGISHHPDEDLPAESFAAAVETMRHWIEQAPTQRAGSQGHFAQRLVNEFGGRRLELKY